MSIFLAIYDSYDKLLGVQQIERQETKHERLLEAAVETWERAGQDPYDLGVLLEQSVTTILSYGSKEYKREEIRRRDVARRHLRKVLGDSELCESYRLLKHMETFRMGDLPYGLPRLFPTDW